MSEQQNTVSDATDYTTGGQDQSTMWEVLYYRVLAVTLYSTVQYTGLHSGGLYMAGQRAALARSFPCVRVLHHLSPSKF